MAVHILTPGGLMPRRVERAVPRRRPKSVPSETAGRRPAAGARLDRQATRWVRAFRALGDATRARVVLALAQEELCVGDLASRLGTSSSVVSHQLRVLRDLGLVKCRRSGRQAYYTLHEVSLRRLFEDSLARVREMPGTRTGGGHGGV